MKPCLHHVAEASDHRGDDRIRRYLAGESIGVGEEVTLKRRSIGIQIVDERGLLRAAQESRRGRWPCGRQECARYQTGRSLRESLPNKDTHPPRSIFGKHQGGARAGQKGIHPPSAGGDCVPSNNGQGNGHRWARTPRDKSRSAIAGAPGARGDFQHDPIRETAVRPVEVPRSPCRARQAERYNDHCEFKLHSGVLLSRLCSFSR